MPCCRKFLLDTWRVKLADCYQMLSIVDGKTRRILSRLPIARGPCVFGTPATALPARHSVALANIKDKFKKSGLRRGDPGQR